MTRRPQFLLIKDIDRFDVADYKQFHGHDILECSLGFQELWYMRLECPRKPFEEHLSICLDNDTDPFEWYADILAHPRQPITMFDVCCRSSKIRERLPWVNPFWYRIELHVTGADLTKFKVCYNKCTDGRPDEWSELLSYSLESVEHVRTVYKHLTRVRQDILLTFPSEDNKAASLLLMALGDACRRSYPKDNHDIEYFRPSLDKAVLTVPAAMARELGPVLRWNGRCAVLYIPIQCYLNPHAKHASGFWIRDIRPVVFAEHQWYGYHKTILEAALVLHSVFGRYDLLEVLDWLPCMTYWLVLRKANLLNSIYDSINRIRPLPSEPPSVNTNKR